MAPGGGERRGEIDRALGYPYGRPSGSYVFGQSGAVPLDTYLREHGITLSELISGSTPVLAIGSNASPEQLKRKSENRKNPLTGEIPVVRAALRDFDVVYSAHIVSYGAVPATLRRSEGVAAEIFVTWLDPDQLRAMHRSEAEGVNYDFIRLWDISVAPEAGEAMEEIYSYHSKWGCLEAGGRCVSLIGVPAVGRKFAAMEQEEVQERVMELLGARGPVCDFIFENIDDENLRRERNERLKKFSAPFGWDRFENCGGEGR
ncbi:MAG: hypothetical protein V3V56_01975 [bacterium]